MLALKIIVALTLMASTPVWIRALHADSFLIALVRLSIGLSLTLLVFYRKVDFARLFSMKRAFLSSPAESSPRTRESLRTRDSRLILPVIGLLFGAHWFTYFESIRLSSASLGILALSTYGIHVTWLGAAFANKRPHRSDVIALLIAAFGAWLCVPSIESDRGAFIGFMFGLLSALFYASLPLLHQRIAKVSLATRGSGQFFYAWLLFLPFGPSLDFHLSGRSWVYLAILGVFCTFIAHNLWISITTEVRPSTTGLINYLSIFVTMLLESVFLHAIPPWSAWAGAACIVLGNVIALIGMRMRNNALERSKPQH